MPPAVRVLVSTHLFPIATTCSAAYTRFSHPAHLSSNPGRAPIFDAGDPVPRGATPVGIGLSERKSTRVRRSASDGGTGVRANPAPTALEPAMSSNSGGV